MTRVDVGDDGVVVERVVEPQQQAGNSVRNSTAAQPGPESLLRTDRGNENNDVGPTEWR